MDLSLGSYGIYFRPVHWHLGIDLILSRWDGDLLPSTANDGNITDVGLGQTTEDIGLLFNAGIPLN
ncbi:hypothetical protein [Tumidithrix helvetica]|uniref:hypothetical protein n=1 Tax=Tumidithrix helvetica TaxID=3457545 RepID=UPI003CC50356